MKKAVFLEIKDKISRRVGQNRLKEAFGELRSLAEGMMAYEVADEAARAEENYRMMLDYAAKGAEDPQRGELTAELGGKILALTDRLERRLLRLDEPSLYYAALRFEALQRGSSFGGILQEYSRLIDEDSMLSLLSGGSPSGTPAKKAQALAKREQLERRLFNRLWVSYPISGPTRDALKGVFSSATLPDYFKTLMVSATTLGGLAYYEPTRLEMLLEVYATSASPKIQAAALVGALLMMHRWASRPLSRRVTDRLNAARELPDWTADLRAAFLALARTRDTDRISRKFREEILPEMMKMRSDISKKFPDENALPSDPEELEENPEWQEMLERSGLQEKLRELNEIQEEGGDVMAATFSNLKSFPFFADVANWFLPFHPDRSEVVANRDPEESKKLGALADIMNSITVLCDNDKYSMLMAYGIIPTAQREAMLGQIEAHRDHLSELELAALDPNSQRRTEAVNKYVQNLYRFFTLFRRKGEFFNPFALGVNLVSVDSLRHDLEDEELLKLVGEFYFTHQYYPEALQVFKLLETKSEPSVEISQKMGHILQQLGDVPGAIARFEEADMLSGGENAWTLRRLGKAYLSLGDNAKALNAFQRLEPQRPSDPSLAMLIGRTHIALEQYGEAVKALYKAEYLEPESPRVWRPLAWSLLMARDFPQARNYFNKLINASAATAEDYLNMGHLSLAEGNFREAVNFYSLNLENSREGVASPGDTPDVERFISSLRADIPALQRIGVDPSMVPIVIDSLLYSLR